MYAGTQLIDLEAGSYERVWAEAGVGHAEHDRAARAVGEAHRRFCEILVALLVGRFVGLEIKPLVLEAGGRAGALEDQPECISNRLCSQH